MNDSLILILASATSFGRWWVLFVQNQLFGACKSQGMREPFNLSTSRMFVSTMGIPLMNFASTLKAVQT